MKNKGFTLTELIAVLVVLSVIILLSVGVYNNVRKNVLEGQYKNVLIRIENAAEEYANELQTTNVIYITVDELIKIGKLSPDDEDYIYDPRDNTIMNCYSVKIILEDDEYIASLDEKYENEDGTCNIDFLETNNISIYCDGNPCLNDWYNQDIELSINGIAEEELKDGVVEWTNLLGLYKKQDAGTDKKVQTEVNSVLATTFNVKITTSEKVYNLSESIKIDKEEPILINKNINVDYKTVQALSINASDKSGAGIDGYALTTASCDTASYSDLSSFTISGSGIYNICIKDKVGNINQTEITINDIEFNVNNTSSEKITKIPTFYLADNPNIPLLKPERNGYNFNYWINQDGERIYSLADTESGDKLKADWRIIDIEMPVDKIDKDSVGVLIENKVNLILVIDRSSSISDSDFNTIQDASKEFIEHISFTAGSTASIVSFNSSSIIELETSTNKEEILDAIDGISSPSGGTNFYNALSKVLTIVNKIPNNENTYMIFMSDGISASDASDDETVGNKIKTKGVTSYTIGVPSADEDVLKSIATSDEHYSSISDFSEIFEIFTKIQEEIREETKITSENGLIELPNLFVTTEFPFIITIGETNYEFTTINEMKHLLTVKNESYYLDLAKVDDAYKLDGDLSEFKFTYYYE